MNDWFEAEQRIERAQEFSESQRWAEALAELDAALGINPTVAIWHAQRGYLLEELDRPEDAVGAYERALELEPDEPDIAVALGVALARLGRNARALEVFEELARRYPGFEPAYCHRISIYTQLGRHDQAEEMFYLAQELDNSCPQCFFQIGASLAARGQTDRALYCWHRVLELDPACAGVNRRIAQAYRAQGRLDLAREHFLREIREDPGNTDLLFELGEMMFDSGRLEAAESKFEQILELDPDHEEARFALGRARLARGNPAEALACFDTVLATGADESELPGLEWNAGKALFELGRFAEATRRLETVAALHPTQAEVLGLLGNSLAGEGKLGEAADCFRRILALDAQDPLVHHSLAVCLRHTGRHEASLEHCLEAIRLKPDFSRAMYDAGIAYLRLERWADACEMLRCARRLEPGNASLRWITGRIWRYRLGHYLRKFSAPLWALSRRSRR